MPTALTHALAGGALVQAAPPEVGRWRLSLLLITAAVLPDLDAIGFLFGVPYGHPLGHRGFSHSLVFSFLSGFFLCWAFFPSSGPLSGKWRRIFFLTFLAASSHGFLDAATDAGLGIGFFIPFDNHRYFLPFRPILTAYISPKAFFSQPSRSLAILQTEALYVWIPLLAVSIIFRLAKAWRHRRRPGNAP